MTKILYDYSNIETILNLLDTYYNELEGISEKISGFSINNDELSSLLSSANNSVISNISMIVDDGLSNNTIGKNACMDMQKYENSVVQSNSFLNSFPTDVMYTVKKGDNLSAIAARYNVELSHLVAANKGTIKNPNLIYPGQKIIIPNDDNSIQEPKPQPTPEIKPVIPEVKPVTPEVKPVNPEIKPATPEVKPETPEVKPETPEVKPETPEVKPETPEVKPVTPEVKPETPEVKSEPEVSIGDDYSSKVGTVVADVSKYNNSAATNGCVWYVRGRVVEKGFNDTGAIGHGKQMALNCKDEAKLSATRENLKGDVILSYRYGTSPDGQIYGHAIYIEDVVGNNVYYTECVTKSYPAGAVKVATIDQILGGTAGCGREPVGLIDVAKI